MAPSSSFSDGRYVEIGQATVELPLEQLGQVIAMSFADGARIIRIWANDELDKPDEDP